MKCSILVSAVVICAVPAWLVANTKAQQASQTASAQASAVGDAEEQKADAAIRLAAQEFTEAFDRRDAEALAKHFTVDGVYINEDGQRFEGRKSIQQEYATLFADNSDLRLQLEIDSIRLVNASTAIEEGRAGMTPQPAGITRVMSRYTAVHARQDGKWLMVHVRDTRVEVPPDFGQLEDLDWLVGTWTAAGEKTQVEVKGRWIENRHFLARSHQVTESGKVTSTGLQIVGLDPSTGQITSWSFTGDGGHAVGRWAPHDDGWIVESVGTMNDGTPTIATDVLQRKDKDTLLWTSGDRFAGDAPLPDTQTVTLKRK